MQLNALKEIIDSDPNLYQLLKGCPYMILNQWETREYRAGSIICHQGDKIDRLYIIISGYADIFHMAENGKRYLLITLKKGDIIGEIEILDQKPYSANMEAYSDLKTIEISRDCFLEWMDRDRNINFYITRILSERFYHLVLKAGKDTLHTLKHKLCLYILSRSKHISNKTTNIEIRLDREKLSEEFAVTSRSINRILHDLQKKNIIEAKPGFIIVKDLERLALEENSYDP